MWITRTPRARRLSESSERWHFHGTASAHMIAVRFAAARAMRRSTVRAQLEPGRGEEREELVERAGRVADGPDGHTIAVGQNGRHRIRLTEERNCIRSPEPDTASTPRAGRLR